MDRCQMCVHSFSIRQLEVAQFTLQGLIGALNLDHASAVEQEETDLGPCVAAVLGVEHAFAIGAWSFICPLIAELSALGHDVGPELWVTQAQMLM